MAAEHKEFTKLPWLPKSPEFSVGENIRDGLDKEVCLAKPSPCNL